MLEKMSMTHLLIKARDIITMILIDLLTVFDVFFVRAAASRTAWHLMELDRRRGAPLIGRLLLLLPARARPGDAATLGRQANRRRAARAILPLPRPLAEARATSSRSAAGAARRADDDDGIAARWRCARRSSSIARGARDRSAVGGGDDGRQTALAPGHAAGSSAPRHARRARSWI